jgi:hypothetical protein
MSESATTVERPAAKPATRAKRPAKSQPPKKPAATAKPKPEPKPPKFPVEVSAAVKFARMDLHGKNPALKADQRPAAASAGDHIAVREVIARIAEGDTEDAILSVTGLTYPKFVKVAQFAPDTADDLKTLRESPLGVECAKFETNKAWRTGRYLAGIVAAMVHQMREAAKS